MWATRFGKLQRTVARMWSNTFDVSHKLLEQYFSPDIEYVSDQVSTRPRPRSPLIERDRTLSMFSKNMIE